MDLVYERVTDSMFDRPVWHVKCDSRDLMVLNVYTPKIWEWVIWQTMRLPHHPPMAIDEGVGNLLHGRREVMDGMAYVYLPPERGKNP